MASRSYPSTATSIKASVLEFGLKPLPHGRVSNPRLARRAQELKPPIRASLLIRPQIELVSCRYYIAGVPSSTICGKLH